MADCLWQEESIAIFCLRKHRLCYTVAEGTLSTVPQDVFFEGSPTSKGDLLKQLSNPELPFFMLGKDSLECFESYGALSQTASFIEGCYKVPFYSIFRVWFLFHFARFSFCWCWCWCYSSLLTILMTATAKQHNCKSSRVCFSFNDVFFLSLPKHCSIQVMSAACGYNLLNCPCLLDFAIYWQELAFSVGAHC